MVTRSGTGVTGSADGAANSIAASSHDTIGGKPLTVFVKWEVSAPTVTSVTDTAGNTYVITDPAQIKHSSGGEPHGCWAHCDNPIAHATNVIQANFSAASATFRRIIVEQWNDIVSSDALDGTPQSLDSDLLFYSTGSITTTRAGLVVMGVAGFSTLTGPLGTGFPKFQLAGVVSDAFIVYLLSKAARVVTPTATVQSAAGATIWVALSLALKGTLVPTDVSRDELMHQTGIPNTALRDVRAWL